MKTVENPLRKAQALLGLQFLSDFGDQITSALLAACLLDITKSAGKVGFVYFITTLGYIIFTLVGGFIGDRLSRRNILLYSDVGRGFVVLLMIFALEQKSISMIYLTSFLLSVLGSLHRPVKLSIWAESIPSHTLERYNSLSEFSVQASMIVGPLIASFFILKEWTSLGFLIDALSFFVCAVFFAHMISRRNCSKQIFQKTSGKDFLKGFSVIFKQQEMLRYVSYDAIQMIGFGAFNATFLVLAQRDFGWSKADYSYHLSIVALFTTIGALMGATRYIASLHPVDKLIWCGLSSAIALCGVFLIGSFPMCSILVGICDGLSVLTMAATKTRVQIIAKLYYADSLSSIIAARSIIIKISTLLGVGACLMIDDFLSLETTLTILASTVALSVLPLVIGTSENLPVQANE